MLVTLKGPRGKLVVVKCGQVLVTVSPGMLGGISEVAGGNGDLGSVAKRPIVGSPLEMGLYRMSWEVFLGACHCKSRFVK